MQKLSLPATRVVVENLSTILTFALSRKASNAFLANHFSGEWKALQKALFDLPEERAMRACIELAIFLRELDNNGSFATSRLSSIGRLVRLDGTDGPLSVREAANKIIHATELEWRFTDDDGPILVCSTSDTKWGWWRADVYAVDLATQCDFLI